jgi:hypothetical protein
MLTETKVNPTGTGQQGAGSPAGANKDIPVHIEGGKPVDKIDQIANRAAHKANDRQQHDDATVFTK